MSNLQDISEIYESLDLHLQQRHSDNEDTEGETTQSLDRTSAALRINDQAYFVLAWGQLEAEIDDACRTVIRIGRSDKNWRHHRVWSLFNPDERRISGLSFEDRLSLVLEKSSDEWKRVRGHYRVRNQIAHGNLLSTRIDVVQVIQEFISIRELLARE